MSPTPDTPAEPLRAADTSAPTARLAVVVPITVLMGWYACAQVASPLLPPFYRGGRVTTSSEFALLALVQCGRDIGAGLLVDAVGARTAAGLAMIGWCLVTTASGFVTDPLAGRTLAFLVALCFGPLVVGGATAIRRELPPDAMAIPYAIFDSSTYLWRLAGPTLLWFAVAPQAANGDPAFGRHWPALVCTTVGAFITFIWLTCFRERYEIKPPDRSRQVGEHAMDRIGVLLRARRIWTLFFLTGLSDVAREVGRYRGMRFLDRDRGINAHSIGAAIYMPYVSAFVAALVAAYASDRLLRRTGSLARARRPFVMGSFALTASMGLLPILPAAALVPTTCLAGVGIGMQVIIGLLVLDLVPRRMAGTIVGLVIGFGSLVHYGLDRLAVVLYGPAKSYVPILLFGALLSLVGVASARAQLRDIVPIEEAERRADIPGVFS